MPPSQLDAFPAGLSVLYDYGILDQSYETGAGFVHLDNNQQNELLTAAGFKNIERMQIGRGMFDFITATK